MNGAVEIIPNGVHDRIGRIGRAVEHLCTWDFQLSAACSHVVAAQVMDKEPFSSGKVDAVDDGIDGIGAGQQLIAGAEITGYGQRVGVGLVQVF